MKKEYKNPSSQIYDYTLYRGICDIEIGGSGHPDPRDENAKYDLDYYGEEGYDPEGYGW